MTSRMRPTHIVPPPALEFPCVFALNSILPPTIRMLIRSPVAVGLFVHFRPRSPDSVQVLACARACYSSHLLRYTFNISDNIRVLCSKSAG